MSGPSRTGLMTIGAIVALLGVIAIAVPVFTTHQTKDVANIGDVHLTAQEDTTHFIPPMAGPAALVLGVVLIGGAAISPRR